MSGEEPRDEEDDPEFLACLVEALERIDRGESLDVGAICGDRPELAPDLSAALERMDRLHALHRRHAEFDPRVGTLLNSRYALRERIGVGGMGVVYRAVDGLLKRPVAVKMLRPERIDRREVEDRLVREATVLASFHHPSIVTVHDCGQTEDECFFLVMDLLDGRGAHELIEDVLERSSHGTSPDPRVSTQWLSETFGGSVPLDSSWVRQVVSWIAQVARGLHEVHERGVVHRDVKPSNVFVRRDGRAVLIDFGLVTLGRDATLASRDVALGTPAYMAPEQLDPKNVATPSGDVYGLTATLHHLLTFERPYAGTPQQVLAALQKEDIEPAQRLRPGLPRDLQAILDLGLQRDPKRRYPSAAALADDLEAWLEFRPIQARPLSNARRTARRLWRNVTVRAFAYALILLAIVSLAYGAWWWRGERVRREEDERRRNWDRLWARVPPSLFIAPKELRVPADENADREIGALLDELVQHSASPLPSRLLRAGHRTDRGLWLDALEDLKAIAEVHPGALLAALIRRYEEVAPRSTTEELSLEDLPEPRSDVDRFVLAFHLVRAVRHDRPRALALLRECEESAHGADELELLLGLDTVSREMPLSERTSIYRETYDACLLLEEARGRRQASTRQGIGLALLRLRRHEEALEALRPAEELAPHDFIIALNAGTARWLCSDLEGARACLERAIALQPRSLKSHETLTRVALSDEDYEEARRRVEETPFTADAEGERARTYLEGLIRFRETLSLLRIVDAPPSPRRGIAAWLAEVRAQAASLALGDFVSATYDDFAAARNPEARGMSFEMAATIYIASGDPRAFSLLADYVAVDPLAPQRLHEFTLLIPRDLSTEQTASVRKVFEAMVTSLAPPSEPFR